MGVILVPPFNYTWIEGRGFHEATRKVILIYYIHKWNGPIRITMTS